MNRLDNRHGKIYIQSFYSWFNELSVVIYQTFYKVLGFPYIMDNTVLSITQIKAAVDIIIKY